MLGRVYLITNRANGKIYVGKTIRPVQERLRRHFSQAKFRATCYLHHAMLKYGRKAFVIEELAKAPYESLAELERRFIVLWNTENPAIGYNLTKGGEGILGFKHSAATRKKMSKPRRYSWSLSIETRTRQKLSWTLERRKAHSAAIAKSWALRRKA